MTDESMSNRVAPTQRRRMLGLLSGLGLLGLFVHWRRVPASVEEAPRALSLREADFYRPHDLAG